MPETKLIRDLEKISQEEATDILDDAYCMISRGDNLYRVPLTNSNMPTANMGYGFLTSEHKASYNAKGYIRKAEPLGSRLIGAADGACKSDVSKFKGYETPFGDIPSMKNDPTFYMGSSRSHMYMTKQKEAGSPNNRFYTSDFPSGRYLGPCITESQYNEIITQRFRGLNIGDYWLYGAKSSGTAAFLIAVIVGFNNDSEVYHIPESISNYSNLTDMTLQDIRDYNEMQITGRDADGNAVHHIGHMYVVVYTYTSNRVTWTYSSSYLNQSNYHSRAQIMLEVATGTYADTNYIGAMIDPTYVLPQYCMIYTNFGQVGKKFAIYKSKYFLPCAYNYGLDDLMIYTGEVVAPNWWTNTSLISEAVQYTDPWTNTVVGAATKTYSITDLLRIGNPYIPGLRHFMQANLIDMNSVTGDRVLVSDGYSCGITSIPIRDVFACNSPTANASHFMLHTQQADMPRNANTTINPVLLLKIGGPCPERN